MNRQRNRLCRRLFVCSTAAMVLLAMLSGCKSTHTENASGSSDTSVVEASSDSSVGDTSQSANSVGSTVTGTSNAGGTTSKQSGGKTVSHSSSSSKGNNVDGGDGSAGTIDASGTLTVKVETFGAKGDGKTDDGAAVNDAIQEASNYTAANNGKKAVVLFATGKTYVVKSQNYNGNGSWASMLIQNASNVTLAGSRTVIVGRPDWSYLVVTGSSGITVRGLNFTFDTDVAVRATVTARSGATVTFSVPQWYTNAISKATLPANVFAIPANGRRDHSWISSVSKVDGTHCRITFSGGGYSLMNAGSKVDLPTPGYSHIGTAFSIRGNSGTVSLQDCNVWNAAQFVFQVNNNSGEIRFSNVTLGPRSSSSCPTVAWRDVVHCKDNRGKLTVNNCHFSGTHDDLFNISNTVLTLTSKVSGTDINVKGNDYGSSGAYVALYKGDTVTAFNPSSDKYYGTAKITEVVQQDGGKIRIRLSKNLNMDTGAIMYINELAEPGSTITGGTYSGTVRIRASVKITNATFHLIYMWTAYEGGIEGPIPSNITYSNCKFDSADGSNSDTRFSFDCALDNGNRATSYGVSNILFTGCQFAYRDIIDRSVPGVTIR